MIVHVFSYIYDIFFCKDWFTYWVFWVLFTSFLEGFPLILAEDLMLNLELLYWQTILQFLESEAFYISGILLEEFDVEFISSYHRPLLWVWRGIFVFGHLKCQYFPLTDPYYPQLFVSLWERDIKVLNMSPAI